MNTEQHDGELEALLTRCLDEIEERGEAAIDAACRARPDLAPRLRRRLESLARLGLLDADAAAPPAAIGPWRPLVRLGRGGMSTVWLAQDAAGTRVALKVLNTPGELAPRVRARFLREIRAFAELDHPGVVRIVDWGEHEGRLWYAMPYAPGATLADVVLALRGAGVRPADVEPAAVLGILRAALPCGADADPGAGAAPAFDGTWVERCARIALDVADALAHLHARGVVHRDVKPGNVLLRLDGRAQLLDLGLAQVEDEPALTRTGDFAGTPYYVSPEQARGERGAVDGRTDVYSLGATLYELLTLRRPFEGSGSAQVLARIATEEPPAPRRVAPHVPRDLETICLTALEKEPARRYAGAGELAADLRRFLGFQPVRARPAGPLRRALRYARRDPARAAAIALAALVAVGVPAGLLASNAAVRAQRDLADAAAREAAREARTSQLVVEFLVDLFRQPGGVEEGARSGQQLLERGARRAQTGYTNDPLARAALLEAVGRAYQNLGLREPALQSFDRAFALRHRELGEDHPDVARALHRVGALHLELGHLDVARALLARGLAGLERGGNLRTAEAARLRTTLAEVLRGGGDAQRAVEELDLALDVLAELQLDAGPDAARAHERRGQALYDARRCDEARAAFASAARLQGRSLDADLTARARVLDGLARAEECAGDDAAARRTRADLAEIAARLRAARRAPDLADERWTEADDRAALAGFVPPEQPEFDARFQEGVTALQTGDAERAARAFGRCVELLPRHPVAHYNLACALSRRGAVEPAFAALERAARLGFGDLPDRVDVARTDADVALVRRDPRWPALLAGMLERQAALRARCAEPSVLLPGDAPPAAGWPLLVVLREADGMRRSLSDAQWRAVAGRLGCALLVLEPATGAGGAWVLDVRDFGERPWSYVEPVLQAVQRACEREPVDALRIVLAGEGTGALPAFDLAIRSGGLVRGLVALDGPIDTRQERDTVAAAAAAGLRLVVLRDSGGERDAARALFERWFRHVGFGAVAEYRGLASGDDLEAAVAAAMARWFEPRGG